MIVTGADLARMVTMMRSARFRAFDFETNGLDYADGKEPIGYSMGFIPEEGGWPICFYVPLGHRTPEAQADPAHARSAFRDALQGAEGLVGQNLKFDINMARSSGFQVDDSVPLHDTHIQGHMTYEKRALDLESLAENESVSRWADAFEMKKKVGDYLKTRAQAHKLPYMKDQKVQDKQSYLNRFGHSEVPILMEAEYSCRDASHALCVDAKLRSKAMGIGTVYQEARQFLYWNEMMLVRALAEMEYAGQRVDKDYMIRFGAELDVELHDRSLELNRVFGAAIDWSNDTQVRRLLYEYLKLPIVKLTEGGRMGQNRQPAVDREALLSLRAFHPGIDELSEYKARLTAKQNFTTSLAWAVTEDGKVHANFKQSGTASRRLSCTEPNLQNQPKRHKELSKRIRKGWLIDEGHCRIYADYSQVELRFLGWITGAKNFIDAYRSPSYDAYRAGQITYDEYRWHRRTEPAVDVHGNVAKRIFGIDEKHPDWEIKRRAAKIVNFGVPYGGGHHLLMGNPEVRMGELDAKDFLGKYHQGNPEINHAKQRLFAHMMSKRGTPRFANWAGGTVHGPRMRIPDEEIQAEEQRSMFACLVQGSAGELTRFSLVRWYLRYKDGSLPCMATSTVHDEIQYDCELKDLAYCASEVQRLQEDFPLFGTTPIVADLKVSTTDWSETHDYDIWDGIKKHK